MKCLDNKEMPIYLTLKQVLELVKKYYRGTSKELADLRTLDRYQLARRLPELLEMHFVRSEKVGNSD